MAGQIRQPIDIKALEHYITNNVPDIQIPIDVKQVSHPNVLVNVCPLTKAPSLDMANPTRRTSSRTRRARNS
jgi:hypothetical protein